MDSSLPDRPGTFATPTSWWRLTIAAVMALALAGVVAFPPAASAAISIDTNATYAIINVHSGRAIDVTDWSTADGAPLQQWGYGTPQDNRHFRFVSSGDGWYRLRNVHSGKVVDVWGWSTADGAEIRQFTDLNGANQQFRPTGADNDDVRFINRHSGKALEVWEWSTANGARLSQYTDSGGANQTWRLVEVGGSDPGDPGPWSDVADGFAGVNAMGVNGTTGGAAGSTVTVSNQADLERYVAAAEPYVIRVNGAVTISPIGREIRVASDKTIVGVGTSGQIVGGGFFLGNGVHNVIIRNLTIRDTLMPDDDPDDDAYDYDGIQMDGAHHVWIDHNHIHRMNDGLVDSRRDTTHLTVSWNILSDDSKAFGIGWTANVTSRMTIHHNWLRNNGSRNPSTDNVAYAHLYNNYLQHITGYGNYSRGATRMVIENSYFDNVRNPYYPDPDAQLRQTGSIVVNSSGRQETRGSAFNPGDFYTYTPDPAADVPAIVRSNAGPQADIGN
jgi:pectate lyase